MLPIINTMQDVYSIFLNALGSTHTLDVSPSTSVLELKQDIQEKIGVISSPYRLQFGDHSLQDDSHALSQYGIQASATVHLQPVLAGGARKKRLREEVLLTVIPITVSQSHTHTHTHTFGIV